MNAALLSSPVNVPQKSKNTHSKCLCGCNCLRPLGRSSSEFSGTSSCEGFLQTHFFNSKDRRSAGDGHTMVGPTSQVCLKTSLLGRTLQPSRSESEPMSWSSMLISESLGIWKGQESRYSPRAVKGDTEGQAIKQRGRETENAPTLIGVNQTRSPPLEKGGYKRR